MWSNPSRAGATKETAHVPSSAINLVLKYWVLSMLVSPCMSLRISLPGMGRVSSNVSVAVSCTLMRALSTDDIARCRCEARDKGVSSKEES